MDEGKVIEYQGWTMRVRVPEGIGARRVVMLLHGWKGDENVMWIFASRLPKDCVLISPRGISVAPDGGYGWHEHLEGTWPSIDDFRPAVERLYRLIVDLSQERGGFLEGIQADFSAVDLVGFSQGAALIYTFSLLHPDCMRKAAGLAGFLPQGAEKLAESRPLVGKHILAAHGLKDERVPVKMARAAVEVLERAGAQVTYCEDNVGHKLSVNCFRGFSEFFRT